MKFYSVCMLIVVFCAGVALGQQTSAPAADSPQQLAQRVQQLESEVKELKQIVRQLQQGAGAQASSDSSTARVVEVSPPVASPVASAQPVPVVTADDRKILDFLRNTTINVGVDTYYGYNFNNPVGRVNLLRAYDVLSNEFSLNQASVILERAPDVRAGRRWGARLDLQFGQATDTLQGNPSNEPRPQIYRNIFQAYGTYVAPVGKGLNIDFGKWGSSLGIEGNYT